MKQDFLAAFIGSQNQARVLRTLVFNENERYTSREIANRAGITPDVASRELDKLKALGVVRTAPSTVPRTEKAKGKSDYVWFFNESFPHLKTLLRFVKDVSPVRYDEIVDTLKRSGKLSAVVLSGSFIGDDSRPADILVAADDYNETRLDTAVKTLEPLFGKELRYAVFSTPEFRYRLTVSDKLLRDTLDFPHVVLLDRSGML